MIMSNELTTSQIAEAVRCHPSTIRRHRTNLQLFGSVTAPPNNSGRPRRLNPVMIKALCDHLLEKLPSISLEDEPKQMSQDSIAIPRFVKIIVKYFSISEQHIHRDVFYIQQVHQPLKIRRTMNNFNTDALTYCQYTQV
jgi:hypothetical protein